MAHPQTPDTTLPSTLPGLLDSFDRVDGMADAPVHMTNEQAGAWEGGFAACTDRVRAFLEAYPEQCRPVTTEQTAAISGLLAIAWHFFDDLPPNAIDVEAAQAILAPLLAAPAAGG